MRADAAQNRQRVLDAANRMFREHGIDVTVAEIADAAGVGRGTLFRNFCTKDHLIAAVVSERIFEAVEEGRALLDSDTDDAEKMFIAVAELVRRQNENRALFEGVSGEFTAYPEMHAAHDAFVQLMGDFVARGQQAGSVRPEITAMDVIMLMKGICMTPGIEAAPDDPQITLRHIDLICAAISTPAYARPLRGSPPPLPA